MQTTAMKLTTPAKISNLTIWKANHPASHQQLYKVFTKKSISKAAYLLYYQFTSTHIHQTIIRRHANNTGIGKWTFHILRKMSLGTNCCQTTNNWQLCSKCLYYYSIILYDTNTFDHHWLLIAKNLTKSIKRTRLNINKALQMPGSKPINCVLLWQCSVLEY